MLDPKALTVHAKRNVDLNTEALKLVYSWTRSTASVKSTPFYWCLLSMLFSPVTGKFNHLKQPTICKMGNTDPAPNRKIWADELQRSK